MDVDPLDKAMELPGARRYARYVAAVCPFHSDSKPSLLVYPDGFRCTACGERGSLDRLFEQASLHPVIPTAPKAEYRPNVPRDMTNERLALSAHSILQSNPGLQQYLIGRGLERAIRRYKLGYWDGWYTIPVMDEDGDVDEIIFRSGPFIQKQTEARFFQRGGQKPRIYIPGGKLPDGPLFVTFGLFDAITFRLMGYGAATSTIGKGSFRADWIAWWNNFVIIVPDQQEEREAHLLARELGWRARVLLLPYPDGCKDPNDLWQKDRDLLVGVVDESIGCLPGSGGFMFDAGRKRETPLRSERGRPDSIGAAL